MKIDQINLILVLILPLLCIGQGFDVMSYNIKYDNKNDTINNWNDRKAAMLVLIKEKSPTFIGLQEVLLNQLDYLDTSLANYEYIGVGRDDGKTKGEFSPILYDSTQFKMIRSNTFWLSKTPYKVSVGWDAAMERICTYGLFQNTVTKQKLWVFNTHFDHVGINARKNSVKLILKKIKQLNPELFPVILMGDFNLMANEKAILLLQEKMDDGQLISETPLAGPKGTFNGFNAYDPIQKRIDYIFTNGFNVERYLHIDQRLPNKKHISDHLPVLSTVSKK